MGFAKLWDMNVCVVGAGIMGACTARELARRGHRVTVYDQFEPGHRMGSSHGLSRIVRKAYPDPFYTSLMAEGYGMWREIDRESPEPILHEVGLMYFGQRSSPNMVSMARGLTAVDERFELLEGDQARREFPSLRLTPGEVGVWTPHAGWVHASKAVHWILAAAERAGAEIERKRVMEPLALAESFDAVVLCPGGWIRDFVPVPVRVTLQTFVYVRQHLAGPVWIEDGPDLMYGFPSEPGQGSFKIGVHSDGPVVNPSLPGREPSGDAIEKVADVCDRRFGLHDIEIEGAQGCLYTRTPDEDFRFGALEGNVFWASVCSGHGFKFGPWVGRFLSNVVEGRESIDKYPRFAR